MQGYKNDKEAGKITLVKTRDAKDAVPEVPEIPAVEEVRNGGDNVVTEAVSAQPAIPAQPAVSAAFRIETARAPIENNITYDQALQNLADAQAVVDDIEAEMGEDL